MKAYLIGCQLRQSIVSDVREGTWPFKPIEPGLVEWVSDNGAYNGTSYTGIVSNWDDAVEGDAGSVQWICEDDELGEEQEVSLPLSQFAVLLDKAKRYDALVAQGTVAP